MDEVVSAPGAEVGADAVDDAAPGVVEIRGGGGEEGEESDDGGGPELDEAEAEALVQELIAQLDTVVGALHDAEDANAGLQDEIKLLLAEQGEQEELRSELQDQLRERGELMQMMAQQTVSDSSTSSNILDRIRKLRADSEAEKHAFQAEMDAMDAQLAELERNEPPTPGKGPAGADALGSGGASAGLDLDGVD